MAPRKKKAEIGTAVPVEGNVVVVGPDGSTVTARLSFVPMLEGTYKVHDGNTGEVLATYGAFDPTPAEDVDQAPAEDVDQAPETGGAGEGQADASAPNDPAPADVDQEGTGD